MLAVIGLVALIQILVKPIRKPRATLRVLARNLFEHKLEQHCARAMTAGLPQNCGLDTAKVFGQGVGGERRSRELWGEAGLRPSAHTPKGNPDESADLSMYLLPFHSTLEKRPNYSWSLADSDTTSEQSCP